jgi:hypothetical protein
LQIPGEIRQKPPVAAGPDLEVAHRLVPGVEIIREIAAGRRTGGTGGKIPKGTGGMNIGIYIYDRAEVLDFSDPFEVFSTASRVCLVGRL